jgi:hypothetical protein
MAPASSTSILKARFLSSGDIGSPLGHRELVRDINGGGRELFLRNPGQTPALAIDRRSGSGRHTEANHFTDWREWAILSVTAFSGFILRHASRSLSSGAHSRDPVGDVPQDEVSVPHGEARIFAHLEP